MGRLGRLWKWLEPGLIYVDPMIAIYYCERSQNDMETEPADHASPEERFRLSTVIQRERGLALEADRR